MSRARQAEQAADTLYVILSITAAALVTLGPLLLAWLIR